MRLVRHDGRVVVLEARAGHAERVEDRLAREVVQPLSGRAVDSHRQQHIAAVAVGDLGSWREVQPPLAPEALQHVGLGKDMLGQTPARKPSER